MAQAQALGDVEVMAYGEDASGGTYMLVGNDHGTVVQG